MLLPPSKNSSVTRSLRRGVGLLRLLSTHTRVGWRLSDLAAQSELDPATVHRLLTGLCDEQLVTRIPGTRRYTLGALAFELGLAARPYFDLDPVVQRRLSLLAQELRGTLFLKVRSGVDSVCVARFEGLPSTNALMLEVGGRRPLCLTAGGVAMLVRLPQDLQKEIESTNLRTIAQQGENRRDGVRRMLTRSRPLGFGLNLGDIVPAISTVSVPLLSKDRTPVASLGLALETPELPLAMAMAMASRLYAQAPEIETAFEQLRF